MSTQESNIIYSIPVTEKKQGQSAIYRHPAAKFGLLQTDKSIKNLQMAWKKIINQFRNRKFLENFTYNDIDVMSEKLGSWFLKNNYQSIYIHSKNRWQWTLCDIACFRYGIISTPIYDTLGKQSIQHIFKLVQAKLIVCTAQTLMILMKQIQLIQRSKIQTIMILDPIQSQIQKKLQNINKKIIKIQQILKINQIIPEPILLPSHYYTYIFTSGTTGLPKGVIYTHWNMIVRIYAPSSEPPFFDENDIYLSYLPLAHSYERTVIVSLMRRGANIKYYSGSPSLLISDIIRVKPTIMAFVPRLLNLFYELFKQFKHVDKKLAEQAWKIKKQNWEKGIKQSPYDKTVFKPINQLLGGITKFVVGSAATSEQVLSFFKIILGGDFRQGYGQTQSIGGVFTTQKYDKSTGHVGGPNLVNQFKLIDIPEMNYYSSSQPPVGQICIRGEGVFIGYLKDEKNTKQVLDQQGWLHTGDVGQITKNGALKIIDRKKNIYKLSQGEFVAPEKVQTIYKKIRAVSQIFIYGDSSKSYNIGFLVPTKEYVENYAKSIGLSGQFKDLCKDNRVIQYFLNLITTQGRKDGLLGYELVKKLKLLPEPLINYNILTNTMKLQRHLIKQVFKHDIEELYK